MDDIIENKIFNRMKKTKRGVVFSQLILLLKKNPKYLVYDMKLAPE